MPDPVVSKSLTRSALHPAHPANPDPAQGAPAPRRRAVASSKPSQREIIASDQWLAVFAWGLPHVWGSSGGSQGRVGVVRWREPLPEGGAEGAVVDSAADLQQEIGTPSAPAHLLRFVHSTVHQEVGRPLGDGSPDPQAGTVTLGV